jgi:hypothetical protein
MSESLRRVEEGIYAIVLETALPNALAERNRWRQTLKLPGLGCYAYFWAGPRVRASIY